MKRVGAHACGQPGDWHVIWPRAQLCVMGWMVGVLGVISWRRSAKAMIPMVRGLVSALQTNLTFHTSFA